MGVALWSQIRQIMQACRGDIVSGSGSHRRGWLPLKLRQEDHFVGSVSVYSFSRSTSLLVRVEHKMLQRFYQQCSDKDYSISHVYLRGGHCVIACFSFGDIEGAKIRDSSRREKTFVNYSKVEEHGPLHHRIDKNRITGISYKSAPFAMSR